MSTSVSWGDIPWAVVGPLLGVVVVLDLVLLWDLRRHEVTWLPKAAWGVVIVLGSFPLGAVAYWLVGRVPAGRSAPPQEVPAEPVTVATPRLPADEVPWEPDGPVALATHGLRKVYDVPAVDGVDLRVPRGATYGLIGPNGAGKTTLLDLISGLRRPTAGVVELGVDRRELAVLADTPSYEPWLTAREVVDLARRLVAPQVPADRVERALAEVDLVDAADRRTGGFSRGMLQRLGLATCLVGDPSVLLLDEPSSALDPAGRREVLDLIGRLAGQRTVILSTHVLTDVQQVCDTVGVLQQGHLVFQGPIDRLLAQTSTVYRLRVASSNGDAAALLAAAPWVQELVPEGPGGYRLVVSDVVAAEEGLADLLAGSGLRLHAFGPATDLESAFLELTGGRS